MFDEPKERLRGGIGAALVVFGCGACSPLPQPVGESTNGGTPSANPSAATVVVSTSLDRDRYDTSPRSNTATSDTRERDATGSEHTDDALEPRQTTAPTNAAPQAVKAPFSATFAEGDGHWQALGTEPGGGPLFWRTVLHPNERSKFVSVDVVAVDLRRFRLEWVVGAGDLGAASLDTQTPGLISGGWATDVVAVFNGGFQARHGYWGQLSHGVTLVKPKAEGCGVALYSDGSVALGSYEATNQPGLLTYRQAPPCLVANGELNPRLIAGQDAVWAGNGAKEKTRRRSAVGLTKDRQTLFFLVGVEAEPIDLARALNALGADYGLQLDINWNWTRFFLVDGAASNSPSLAAPLLSGMVADKGEYLRRPSKRDFFAVIRRPAEK